MAILKHEGIGIAAVSACVPHNVVKTTDLDYLLSSEEIKKTIDNIGIEERRIAPADVCASDLCVAAAEGLMKQCHVAPDSIDAIIFVSQNPDYRQPSTAPSIQHRLGLPKNVAAFDINMACSGYVYGLSATYAYVAAGMNRVLLLVGDTMSKTVSKRDKVSAQIFGDAGSATLVERGDYGQSVFSLGSDGRGYDAMIIPTGGGRRPMTADSMEEHLCADGSWRADNQFFMDGMAVFNFGMTEEPRDVSNLLQAADVEIGDVDLLIYHQANKFMTDFFTKWLKFDPHKTPYSIGRFGNTSSASIPLTMVAELDEAYPDRRRVVLSGFGAGLSWGSALVDLSKCKILPLIEL